ncbi:MAG: hypothetical protein ACJ76P_11690 [Actinomycetota bacterium]
MAARIPRGAAFFWVLLATLLGFPVIHDVVEVRRKRKRGHLTASQSIAGRLPRGRGRRSVGARGGCAS